jgi:hypothetical protein
MGQPRRKRRRDAEPYDGPFWLDGAVARAWRALLASPDAAEQLQRALAHARQQADAGSSIHAGIACELERTLAELRAGGDGAERR